MSDDDLPDLEYITDVDRFKEVISSGENCILLISSKGCEPCSALENDLRSDKEKFDDIGFNIYVIKNRKRIEKALYNGIGMNDDSDDAPFILGPGTYPSVFVIFDGNVSFYSYGYGELLTSELSRDLRDPYDSFDVDEETDE